MWRKIDHIKVGYLQWKCCQSKMWKATICSSSVIKLTKDSLWLCMKCYCNIKPTAFKYATIQNIGNKTRRIERNALGGWRRFKTLLAQRTLLCLSKSNVNDDHVRNLISVEHCTAWVNSAIPSLPEIPCWLMEMQLFWER